MSSTLTQPSAQTAPSPIAHESFAHASTVARYGLVAEVRKSCGAFEWVTFSYLAWLVAVLITRHAHIANAPSLIALHLAIAAAIATLAVVVARHPENSALHFARSWYPLPLYIFFFEELQSLVHVFFSRWFDRYLIAFDFNFAQVHPSVFLAQFATPALNDAMQFCYMTYFLFLVLLPAILYVQQERRAFWTTMTATALAHYSVYVMALLFPIESPYFSLASLNTNPLVGGPFTATIELVEHFGRVHGAAFPSAHVAGSMVAVCALHRYRPRLFYACFPFFIGMCISTVYGRYHYVADVLAGIALGALAWLTADFLMARRGAVPPVALEN